MYKLIKKQIKELEKTANMLYLTHCMPCFIENNNKEIVAHYTWDEEKYKEAYFLCLEIIEYYRNKYNDVLELY